jgi:hypothetical protein
MNKFIKNNGKRVINDTLFANYSGILSKVCLAVESSYPAKQMTGQRRSGE